MKKDRIKNILQSEYSREAWTSILNEITSNRNLLKLDLEAKEVHLNTKKAQDIVKRLFQLGSLKTSDGNTLPIFEVELQDNIKIEYNKVGVNQLIKKYILKDAGIGAIATYAYSKEANSNEWRFSFISKAAGNDYFDEVENVETNPKKYTYIFGTQEEHRTAIERLYNLEQSRFELADFFEAFNVEPVSNNFFKEYKNFYHDFVEAIASSKSNLTIFKKEAPKDLSKEVRNFTKRLMGRIVFLYFLQKKHWLGASNIDYTDGDPSFLNRLFLLNKEDFYQTALASLFFNALNKADRKNDAYELSDGSTVCIPFLNGGLFEENQEPKTHRKLDIPSHLFEDLFAFFNGYNFTIYENSPEDHTVAVDPEMLGNIFENLLEDNKDKGTFYTPKEVVHYMTHESLIEYLNTHLAEKNRTQLEQLLKHQNRTAFTNADLKQVESLIDTVKVCDPAIGSGAFPMGLLQEIFNLKAFLHYELGKKDWKPAEVKRSIIEKSIYGVDLEEGAVDIARLRFWLSLVVDEETPQALPNLDYKIMQGNSLLECFNGIDLSNISTGTNKKVEELNRDLFGKLNDEQLNMTFDKVGIAEQIQKKIKTYYEAEPVEKPSLKKEIDDLVIEFIHFNVKLRKDHVYSQILEQKEQNNLLSDKQQKQLEVWQAELEKLNKSKELLLNPETTENNYFLWHLFFKDAFDTGGFDIVIGNPPYIQLQSNQGKLAKELVQENYETFTRTGDIYALFYEKGLQLLKPDGVLAYITSSQWMKASYGKSLRNFFAKNNPLKVIDLGPKIFSTATVYSNIMLLQNTKSRNALVGGYVELANELATLKKEDLAPLLVDEKIWTILTPSESYILNSIKEKGKKLKEWEVKINFGVKTGYNEAFIIDQKKRDELVIADEKNEEIIKPVLKGREIERFYVKSPKNYIVGVFPSLKIDIGNYPVIKNYLSSFLPKLYQTGETFINKEGKKEQSRKKSVNKWFETQDPIAFYKEFEEEKVVWKRIGSKMRFSYFDYPIYSLDSTCIATGEKIPYLTTVLNSKLMLYYLHKTSPKTGTGDNIISVQALNPLPVYYPEAKTEAFFENFFHFILFLKKTQNPVFETLKNEHLVHFFEEIIDGCVFELYFKEHMLKEQLNITALVEKELENMFGNGSFDALDEPQKREKVRHLYESLKNSEVAQRMRSFVTKSPTILKPIIQA